MTLIQAQPEAAALRSIRDGSAVQALVLEPEKPKAPERRPVEAGDIFVSSWGYDQTNISYWVVRSVSKTAKTMMVQAIETARVGHDGFSHDEVVPDPSTTRGPVERKKIKWSRRRPYDSEDRTEEPYFTWSSFANAYRLDDPDRRLRQTDPWHGH